MYQFHLKKQAFSFCLLFFPLTQKIEMQEWFHELIFQHCHAILKNNLENQYEKLLSEAQTKDKQPYFHGKEKK